MHNPARLTCPMKQRRTTEDETMILSKDAPKAYEKYVKQEQEHMLDAIQSNCVHSAVTNHFPARIRQQARIFAEELRIELSALLGREVKPCEVYKSIAVLGDYPFNDLENVEKDNPENEGAK